MPDALEFKVPAPIAVGFSGKRKYKDTVKLRPKRNRQSRHDDADYVPPLTSDTVKTAAAALGQKIAFLCHLNKVAFVKVFVPVVTF
jgi:hypothetical protein